MKRALDALLCALAYFTILPAGKRGAPTPDALAALPYTGALIGACAGVLAWAVSSVGSTAFVVATAFAMSIILTGAVHVDGFLDTCDALFASVAPQRRLEILRDPHHGTFAIAGFGVIVVVWLAALESIVPGQLPVVLAMSAATARWAAVLNAFVTTPASERPSSALEDKPPVLGIAFTGMLLCAFAWCFGLVFIAIVPIAAAAALLLGRFLREAFGGFTGDLYGFSIVLLEIAIIVTFGALLGSTALGL
ncbi:MAG TPA: adenosylcobinamide-GDP ribazoletransferase [Candidatus Baltobacteraceae bacterium]